MNDPVFQLYILLAVLASTIRGDNFTEKFMKMEFENKFQSKQHRLLNFNKDTHGEINIEIDFAIPFIEIPVATVMNSTKGAFATFNLGTLVVTGATTALIGFVLPTIVNFVNQKAVDMLVPTTTRALLAAIVRGDNFTEKYMTMGSAKKFQSKQYRLLNFNTEADGEISIEMQFAVPFIRIPVQKAMDGTKEAIANFNVGSLVVTGAIVLVTGFILPALIKIISQKVMSMPIQPASGRDEKTENSEWWRILTLMDQALIENNVDTTSCMQRAVCWAVKTSTDKVSAGQATSRDKIIDGLITNEWVNKIMDGTPIKSAIKNGLEGVNCSNEYNTCKVNQKSLATFVKQFTNAINLT